jgi:hypothetical protein
MCVSCTFRTQTPAERVAAIDRDKAEKDTQKRSTKGRRDNTFAYMRVRDKYIPPRPTQQSPNPAACTAKVQREMRRYGSYLRETNSMVAFEWTTTVERIED